MIRWPDNAKACCVITHDVDSLDNVPSIKRSKVERVRYELHKRVMNKPYDNIKIIIREEEKMGIKSSFYFFCEYPEEGYFVGLLAELKSKGFEIGLHASEHSYDNIETFKKELEELEGKSNQKIYGVRQHLLKFKVPDTWRIQEKLGLRYNLSYYYNEEFGFRDNEYYPYHPHNLNILELPTCFMDWTALNKNLGLEEMKKVILDLAKTVEDKKGCFIVNFHNKYMNKRDFPAVFKLFQFTLDYVKNNNYWITTAKELAEWWRKNG